MSVTTLDADLEDLALIHALETEIRALLLEIEADPLAGAVQTVELFRAKVVDVATDAVTIEATGSADKLSALLRILEPYGIRELVQSGVVGLGRGSRSITDRALRPLDRTA